MTTLTFDTHQFVKSLVASGISEPQAEALVDQLSEVQITNVTTKLDIADVRQEISELRSLVNHEFASLRQEISDVRQEMERMKVDLLKWLVPLLLGQVAAFAFVMQWIIQ